MSSPTVFPFPAIPTLAIPPPDKYNVYRYSLFGYYPTEWICILMAVLFGVSTLAHTYQAMAPRSRTWFMLITAVVAGTLEVLGWAGRAWGASEPRSIDAYLMQICCTILAPTPLLAANFVILGRIIRILGTQYSRLGPKWYTIIFCSMDLIALVVQAIGGGRASVAVRTDQDPEVGGHIMLGGIVFQLFAIIAYSSLATEFFVRYLYDKPVRAPTTPEVSQGAGPDAPAQLNKKGELTLRVKLMSYALVFSTTCLLIRAVYRTIELADGWTGRIITTQVYFNVLDGAMIVLAIYTLNFFHPGYLVYHESSRSTAGSIEEKA